MPKGPRGEWRPADPVAWAAHIGRLATGEIAESTEPPAGHQPRPKPPAPLGGQARAAKLTAEEQAAIAKRASDARWRKAPVVGLVMLSVVLAAPSAAAGPILDSAEHAAARIVAQQQQQTERRVRLFPVLWATALGLTGGGILSEVHWDCTECGADRATYYVGMGLLVTAGDLLIWGLVGEQVPVAPSIEHSPTSGRRLGMRGEVSW